MGEILVLGLSALLTVSLPLKKHRKERREREKRERDKHKKEGRPAEHATGMSESWT